MLLTIAGIMAMQYMGTPYMWAGNNYNGLDCSGYILKVLDDIGYTLPDMTAKQIYDWSTSRDWESCNPEDDCLLFFGKSTDKISHIALALNEKYMAEAGGAGQESVNLDSEELARLDARVRIKPISNRRDLVASIKLKYPSQDD